jgi:sigma-B regulation protein RsbU (phosphoserine phosphatase)
MLLDEILQPKPQRVLEGASDFTRENGTNLICAVTSAVHDRCPLRDLIGPANCDGVLVLSSMLSNFERSIDRIRKFFEHYRPLPYVNMGDPFEQIPGVTVNNGAGMREVITHLIKVHHLHKIAFIRGPETNLEAELRFKVYQQVLEQHGIPFDPDLVADGNWSHASGATAVYTLKDLRRRNFEAIVAANDAMAGGAFEALHARGIHVPMDVAIVGFDNFDGTGYALTTVEQPVYEMGRRGAAALLDLIQKKDVPMNTTLPTELIVRRSCGCFEKDIERAAAPAGPPAPLPLLAVRREAISQAMLRAAGEHVTDVSPEWPEKLFSAFKREIGDGRRGELLSELDAILLQEWMERRHSSTWQNVISELRRESLPCLARNSIHNAENVWHQARVLIAEAAQRVRAQQQRQQSLRTTQLMDVSAVFASLDVKSLAASFQEKLPALGIERCYAVLFEGSDAVPEWSRLVLALDEEETTVLDNEGLRFPSRQLLPPEVLPEYRALTLLALPLLKNGRHLGAIYFEKSNVEYYVYEMLARQFSEPLSRFIKPAPQELS